MNWFLIALIAPAMWSVTNYLDKYLLSKYVKGGGVGALLIFSSLIGLFLLPLMYVFNPNVFNLAPSTAFLITLNAFFYLLAVLPYFHALQLGEASYVVPLFQLTPVLTFILSYFLLGETLTQLQMIGGGLIMLGAVGLSLELSDSTSKKVTFRKNVFLLMLLSSFLFSVNFTVFKFFALDASFWTTSFWEYVGFVIFAAILLVFVKKYRLEFLSMLKENKIPILGLNGFNELVNIVAKVSFNFATLLAPVTIVTLVNGFQPLFIFIYGVFLTVFFPHIVKENIAKKYLIQKIGAITIMLVGTFLLG
ncbi:EamA family transporter [Patescibacteria group bacterium]|nr:EamA family transporter [Patescibacteria group bacterium]